MHDPSHEDFDPGSGAILGGGSGCAERVNNKYKLCEKKGEGGFGVVYSASLLLPSPSSSSSPPPPPTVALKIMRGEFGHDDDLSFKEEVESLRKVSTAPANALVIRMVEAFIDPGYVGGCKCIVLQPLCNYSLENLVDKAATPPPFTLAKKARGRGSSSSTPPPVTLYTLEDIVRWGSQVAQTLHILHTTEGIINTHDNRSVFIKSFNISEISFFITGNSLK